MRWNPANLRNLGMSFALCASLACAGGMTVGIVYAERRPPPDRFEVMVPAPGPGYAWVSGYWRWERNDYHWVRGRWVRVERGYHRMVPGRWTHQHDRWYWVDGHWAR